MSIPSDAQILSIPAFRLPSSRSPNISKGSVLEERIFLLTINRSKPARGLFPF
jgi:hypothetical protein